MTPGPGRAGSSLTIKPTLSSNGLHKASKTFTNNDKSKPLEAYKRSQATGLGRMPETDTLLILADGMIPVHGALLSAVSPFFAKMFDSQGAINIDTREVIMKDYSIQIMKDVIQLIYDEEVLIKSETEYKKVKKVMKSLEIFKNDGLILNKDKSSRKKVGDEICYVDESSTTSNQDMIDSSSESEVEQAKKGSSPSPLPSRKEGRGSHRSSSSNNREQPTTSTKKDKKVSDRDDDDDFRIEDDPISNSSSDSEVSSDDSYSDKGQKSKSKGKRGRKPGTTNNFNGNKPKVMLPKVIVDRLPSSTASVPSSSKPTTTTNNTAAGSSSTPSTKTAPITITVPAKTVNRQYNLPGSKDNEGDEDSDLPSTEEFSDSKYEDKSWFLAEANRCQKCKKTYDGPAKASTCIANHKVLRCYYCFRLCKNTEKLFEHFKRAHKQAGRENFLMCPFCDQSVPYKSVSCHVISLHMNPDGPQKKPPSSRYASTGAGRPPTFNVTAQQPAVKKTKVEEEKKSEPLRVGNLEAIISWKKDNGKIRKFILKKDRGYAGFE